MVSDGIGARGVFLIAARATCRPSRPDFRVGANALAGVRWLGCNSNSTANAFATVAYSYEMEFEFLRSFFPTRARRCHFCMGISKKSRDCDRIMD